MNVSTLVEMVASGLGDRILVGSGTDGLTGERLGELARSAGTDLRSTCTALVYAGVNQPHLPVALLGAAWAGVPFVPVNYRLEDSQLAELIARQEGCRVIGDQRTCERLAAIGIPATPLDDWLASLPTDGETVAGADDDDTAALILYTSGTTATPKAAILRHRHLMAYLLGTIEYASAGDDEAALIAVPPYHIAGMANMLTNLFAGRRLVYIGSFDPVTWLEVADRERITHAMLVPTMLARVVDAIDAGGIAPTRLRTLSYGGSKVSSSLIERALTLMPTTGFVNAYGLTETASTISVLGPDDHRTAFGSSDPTVRRRLISAGRPLPGIEVEIRDDDGKVVDTGESGILYLRGEQVAGEYSTGSVLDAEGWFSTRDRAWMDADGYLYIEGRADDTIIRGGENIAPAEVEEVLTQHAAVAEACVVGLPDDEWGQRLAAVVVRRADVTAEELRQFVYERLRGSKTPETIEFRDALPHTPTGKLLRRVVLAELTDAPA